MHARAVAGTEWHGMSRHLSMKQKSVSGMAGHALVSGAEAITLWPQMRAPISLRIWLARPRSISIGSLVTRLKPRPFCAQT